MIFVVEDDELLRRTLTDFLRCSGQDVESFGDAEGALVAAQMSGLDLVLCDIQLPSMGGRELLDELAKLDPSIIRVVMTAHGSLRAAVDAIRAGCYEYLEKPLDLPKIARLVERALAEKVAARELAWNRPRVGNVLGESAAMGEVRKSIESLAELGADGPPVLLLGETGVGKGLIARELHAARLKGNAPWIEVNCAAIPGPLMEGELFGYERSAFTDAKQAKPGLFEAASGGTLFLDEIGDLPLELQPKLLHVLESRTFRRLGSVKERQARVAIVAASNVDLEKAISGGRFRADLYHRLAGFTIRIPPLRERAADAVLLARTFVKTAAARYRKSCGNLSEEAEEHIRQYSWPGNVRELAFAIEQAVLRAPREAMVLHVVPVAHPRAYSPGTACSPSAPTVDARPQPIRVILPEAGVDFDALERAVLSEALERAQGNITRAAQLLGKSRDWMRYRLGRLGLGNPSENG